ncbi:MAG: hypothetical protein VXZ13_03075, partial [Pseudomonadota bacterium]|nr:hypothetical protein [Pseudomonadota bacterium]
MAFTKIAAAGIGSTETVTLHSLEVINNATVGGVLTYEDVTNVDSIGLITARNGIVVGSGITLSKDGDGFYTGVVTATTFSGAFSGDGSALTGVANTDVIFTDKLSISDNGRIALGIGSDLSIFHDGNNGNSHIKESGSGSLVINADDLYLQNAAGTENLAVFVEDGAVELYHNNSKKLETASGGVTVTGTVAATSYTGDGSALTGIAVGVATTVATGITGITTVLDLSNNDHKITVSGITTVDVRGGTEGDSHSLRIVNSGITTVGFSTYFLFPSGSSPIIPTTDGTISMISFTVHRQGVVGLATQLLAG